MRLRFVPVEYAKGTPVTVGDKTGTVEHHQVDDQVQVKLPSGEVIVVEARDVQAKG
jgi:hypothetical protein